MSSTKARNLAKMALRRNIELYRCVSKATVNIISYSNPKEDEAVQLLNGISCSRDSHLTMRLSVCLSVSEWLRPFPALNATEKCNGLLHVYSLLKFPRKLCFFLQIFGIPLPSLFLEVTKKKKGKGKVQGLDVESQERGEARFGDEDEETTSGDILRVQGWSLIIEGEITNR